MTVRKPAHHDRGRLTPSRDVTDDEEQPLVGELDDIPEVAPDDEVGARQVARPHPRPGNLGNVSGSRLNCNVSAILRSRSYSRAFSSVFARRRQSSTAST